MFLALSEKQKGCNENTLLRMIRTRPPGSESLLVIALTRKSKRRPPNEMHRQVCHHNTGFGNLRTFSRPST
jgi:hypothetical protein